MQLTRREKGINRLLKKNKLKNNKKNINIVLLLVKHK